MASIDSNLAYWSKTADEVIVSLRTNKAKGLSQEEARRRIKQYGQNIFAKKRKFEFLLDLFKSFLNPLILLLIFASGLSAILGDVKDFVLITAIIFVSSFVSIYQHKKAQIAAEKLRAKVVLSATLIRNGVKVEVPFPQVTIGDIVVLSVGDIVPADIRLIEAKEMTIDESSLTGESYPAVKQSEPLTDKQLTLGAQKNMAFAGTHIATGEGMGVVVEIGLGTQFGKLSQQIVKEKPQTAFDKNLNSFGIFLLKATLTLTLFVFFINAFLKHELLTSFLFALALAVGLTPELLPVILTITLSKGALKMSKKEVVVKYLPAIQNLGSMNILCTDKTGTLTENKIELSGYEDITGDKNDYVLRVGIINSLFHSGFDNPLDKALLKHKETVDISDFTKVDDIPYDFDRKRLSVIVKDNQGKDLLMVTKGSTQPMLGLITNYYDGKTGKKITDVVKRKIEKRYEEMSSDGQRVLAVAIKNIDKQEVYSPSDEKDLCFAGFISFFDPPKKDVAATIKHLEQLGVEIKILTGDNEIVTRNICRQTNIPVENIMTGADIEKLSIAALREKVIKTTIFARLTPEQKLMIIEALQSSKFVTGYLGDGVNDAPPIKAADVGISVSNGSDIARDSADVILMRKNLSVLKEGVIEGRATYANILKYIMMETSSNVGNMITVALSSLVLPFLPMLPVQILLNNFLYDLSQLAIPLDSVDHEFVSKPHAWDISFIRKFMLIFGPISSVFDFLTFFALLTFFHANEKLFHSGWFVESLVTQALITFSIRTRKIPFFKSVPSKVLMLGTIAICIAAILIVSLPLGSYFAFTSLPLGFYGILSGIIIAYFVVVEATKWWFYRK